MPPLICWMHSSLSSLCHIPAALAYLIMQTRTNETKQKTPAPVCKQFLVPFYALQSANNVSTVLVEFWYLSSYANCNCKMCWSFSVYSGMAGKLSATESTSLQSGSIDCPQQTLLVTTPFNWTTAQVYVQLGRQFYEILNWVGAGILCGYSVAY